MGRRWCAWIVACTAAAALNSTAQLGPSDRVVYLRIQKTGSKTMVSLLTSSWLFAANGSVTKDAGCLHHAWVGGNQAECERSRTGFANALGRQRGCIVEGHCPYSAVLVASEMVVQASGLRLRFVATLRDPLTRVLSEFRHVCGPSDGAWDYREVCPRACKERVKADEHAADRCATPQAIETYVTDRANANGVYNRQARMLAGSAAQSELSESDLLESAERTLALLDAVIVLERFPLSLAVASRRFGVSAPNKYYHVNEPKERRFAFSRLAPSTEREIRSRNGADMWLWTTAVRRLEEDAEELFGTVDDAEACSRYDCGTIARLTLSKGANAHYTDVQCVAAFDKDACAYTRRQRRRTQAGPRRRKPDTRRRPKPPPGVV